MDQPAAAADQLTSAGSRKDVNVNVDVEEEEEEEDSGGGLLEGRGGDHPQHWSAAAAAAVCDRLAALSIGI